MPLRDSRRGYPLHNKYISLKKMTKNDNKKTGLDKNIKAR